jgi:hypothetical protein
MSVKRQLIICDDQGQQETVTDVIRNNTLLAQCRLKRNSLAMRVPRQEEFRSLPCPSARCSALRTSERILENIAILYSN